jgi:hypothetical protein
MLCEQLNLHQPRLRKQFAYWPSIHHHRADAVRRNCTYEDLGVPKCPKCGYRIVARLKGAGPYFYCLCGKGDFGEPGARAA